jgi:hypothetical protein
MLYRLTIAQCFIVGGAMLAVLGLILFWSLPVKQSFPPFLLTALLSIGYGAYEMLRGDRP